MQAPWRRKRNRPWPSNSPRFDEKLIKYGALFRERFMDIRVSMPVIEALDRCWETLADCFEPGELLMKQDLIDKYFSKEGL